MILKALHRVASAGPVYDLIQTLVGVKLIYRRLQRVLSTHTRYRTVLDLGGGTGRARALLSSDCTYYCLDNEAPKLLQFLKQARDARAILADATSTPVASASMDLVLCMAVSHHLSDAELDRVLSEATRVLRPEGRVMFYDALWHSTWLPGRLLWSLDRGSNPRSKGNLLSILSRHLDVTYQESFSFCHKYMVAIGSKNEG